MPASVILTVKNGRLVARRYQFDGPQRCLIGRGSDCEIRLPAEPEFMTVSRHHCLLDIDPPTVRVRDSGSTNGTFVNGMQIGRPAKWHLSTELLSQPCLGYDLSEGDELKVGDTVFDVQVMESEAAEPEPVEKAAEARELCACG